MCVVVVVVVVLLFLSTSPSVLSFSLPLSSPGQYTSARVFADGCCRLSRICLDFPILSFDTVCSKTH